MTWLSTKEIRRDLAAMIHQHVSVEVGGERLAIVAHAGPLTGGVNPPCAVIGPDDGDDYIETTSIGAEQINLKVWLLGRDGEPLASLDEIDDMVDQLRPALQFHASPAGRSYTYGSVSRPARWTVGQLELPGVAMSITTQRTVEAP